MKEVSKDMTIGEVLDKEPGLAYFFLQVGMHCLGCPAARGETIEEACMVHGVDCSDLLSVLNEFLANKAD